MFNCREMFFPKEYSVSLFHESSYVHPLLNEYCLEYCHELYTIYLRIFRQGICNFKIALAAIYLNGTIIISGGHLQWSSIFKVSFFLDTWRKLNVHKMFTRHPRRLLNVLCTFNLRYVSRELFLWNKHLESPLFSRILS